MICLLCCFPPPIPSPSSKTKDQQMMEWSRGQVASETEQWEGPECEWRGLMWWQAATHRGYSWSPASLSLSLPTLQDSLCPAPSRCSIDICWMSSVNDQLVALIYSRNHMTSRERRYLMSQIHLVGESVFMIPGLKAKYHHSPLSNWPEDFPHHSSHEQLRVTATHKMSASVYYPFSQK